jgi:hypothetical protein
MTALVQAQYQCRGQSRGLKAQRKNMELIDYIDRDEGRDFGDAPSFVAVLECGNCGHTAKELRHVPEFDYMGCERCYHEAIQIIEREARESQAETIQWTPNFHVHPAFSSALNSWASIGNWLYVRTAPRKKGGRR